MTAIGFDHSQKSLDAGSEMFWLGNRIIMIAIQFPKEFRFVGGGEILLRMMKADQSIQSAMHDKHGDSQPRKFAAGLVFY